jgi:hypothetical protein
MPLGMAKLGGIIFLEHLQQLALNPIPNTPLHDKCAGEETNVTAINPVGNLNDSDGHLLLHFASPGNGIRHEDLLATKFDEDVILQNIATASMLLAAAPTVGASSPNNIKDDAAGMLARHRRICASRSHIGLRRHRNSLVFCAGSSAHDAVFAPLVGGRACTTFPFKSWGRGGHVGLLWCGCGV